MQTPTKTLRNLRPGSGTHPSPMSESAHSLRIPGVTQHLGKVRRFVEKYAREADLDEEAIAHVTMAVDEACANVIKHAYNEDGRDISIRVAIDPERFTVCIEDQGRPFQPELWSEPDIFQIAESRRRGGLGVQIMRSLMDEVEYETRDDTNQVRLTKFRRGAPDRNAPKTA